MEENNKILLEYFSGRSKELEKCEEYLKEIIQLIKIDHDKTDSFIDPVKKGRSNYRSNQANSKLEYELAKLFKIKSVNIYWNNGSPNAMTLEPLALMRPKYKSNLEVGKYSNMNISVLMFEELVYMANLNEKELLAVILHEIGHCFYWCPVTVALTSAYLIINMPFNIIKEFLKRTLQNAVIRMSDFSKTNFPLIYNMVNCFTDLFNEIFSWFNLTIGPAHLITNALMRIKNGKILSPMALPDYGAEKGADSFAARYGYATELTTAMYKVDNPENLSAYKAAKKFGTFGSIMVDISAISSDLVSMMTLDPHPSTMQRASSMIKKLKKDLDTGDFPPEMEQDLRDEIARMELAYNTILNGNEEDKIHVRKAWYGTLDKLTHGKSDIREALNFYFDAFKF